MEKSTLRFEEKLREKVQATLAHIHALTAQKAGEYVPVQAEQLPAKLKGKVEALRNSLHKPAI